MTPKQKATQLTEEFYLCHGRATKELAKEASLLCVDQILQIKSVYHDIELNDYWEEVKVEIEKL